MILGIPNTTVYVIIVILHDVIKLQYHGLPILLTWVVLRIITLQIYLHHLRLVPLYTYLNSLSNKGYYLLHQVKALGHSRKRSATSRVRSSVTHTASKKSSSGLLVWNVLALRNSATPGFLFLAARSIGVGPLMRFYNNCNENFNNIIYHSVLKLTDRGLFLHT